MLPPATDSAHTLDSAVYATYMRLWNVTKTAEAAGRNIFHLDSAEIAALDTVSIPLVSYNPAQVMLTNITGIYTYHNYGFPIPCTTIAERNSNPNGGSIPPAGNNNALTASNTNGQFSVFPNPASGMVTFSYNAPGGGDITITITDLPGQAVMQQHTANTAGSLYWNPANVAAGMYILQSRQRKRRRRHGQNSNNG